jgi:hypothetical protein
MAFKIVVMDRYDSLALLLYEVFFFFKHEKKSKMHLLKGKITRKFSLNKSCKEVTTSHCCIY